MRSNINKYLLTAGLAMLAPLGMFAADAAPAKPDSGYNILYMTLMGLALILLFFIIMLANNLRLLSEVQREKASKSKKLTSGTLKSIVLLLAFLAPALSSMAADSAAPATAAAAEPAITQVGGMAIADYYTIIGFIIFEMIIIFALVLYTRVLSNVIKGKYEAEDAPGAPQKSWFWDNFNAATPIEKEKDILLDHNYDGIQELDNSLPPWWKYGFYLTIIVGVIYLYRFHISHEGPSSAEELAIEMQAGEAQKAAAGNQIDETNVTLLTDAAAIGEGKNLFTANCVACHLADGGGSVGPNLTDDYWLHKGGIKNVFNSIKNGWQDKGMKAWKDDFSPKQIQEIASFVMSLHGTKPATPKAPQGELYVEAGAPAAGADSTAKPAADSAKAGK